MKVFKPMGARLLVEEIVTSLSLEERGKLSNLVIVVESDNRPPASMGYVRAIGNDPIFIDVGIKAGDVVHFAPRAGYEQWLEGKRYRMLEWQEITALEQEEPKSEYTASTTPDHTELPPAPSEMLEPLVSRGGIPQHLSQPPLPPLKTASVPGSRRWR
jgi:co-chaperonin GroES (HSP10)